MTSVTFPSNYASYLQSYEISLLAQSILNVKDEIADIEIFGHFHDGALLIFPHNIKKTAVEESLLKEIERTKISLGLAFPQKFSFDTLFKPTQEES